MLCVTVAQPDMSLGGLAASISAHAAAVREAESRLVVFPELSLTGYDLTADPVDPGDSRLAELVTACCDHGSVALVGAPIREAQQDFIATLKIDGRGVEVAYRKRWLGADEQVRFSPGSGPVVLDIDGWRIGLAICKDTGVDDHSDSLAEMGIDVYAAGVVHHAEELTEQRRRVERIAARCNAYVLLASCAGPTGEGYDRTAGHSVIWDPRRGVVAEADDKPGIVLSTTLVPARTAEAGS